MARRGKFGNKKVTVDGFKFDSIGEGQRWLALKALERSGAIRNLRRQVRIPLKVNGKKVCDIVPDFCYEEKGKPVTEDWKSEYTAKLPVFRLKAKLFEALFGYPIRVTQAEKRVKRRAKKARR